MAEIGDEAARLVAEALNIQPSDVNEKTALDNTPQWDSLAHMRLILSLEKRLGRKLKPETIVGLTGIQNIIDLLADED